MKAVEIVKKGLGKVNRKFNMFVANSYRVVSNERGDGVVGGVGWTVIVVAVIVALFAIVTQFFPDFVEEKILGRLRNL